MIFICTVPSVHNAVLVVLGRVMVRQFSIIINTVILFIIMNIWIDCFFQRALVMPNMDDILFPLMCDHVTNVHVPPTGNPE